MERVNSKKKGFIDSNKLLITHISMMFLCIINFDIMRNLKESLLITRLGAEAIPFVKFWVVVPVAFIFLISYSWLANKLPRRKLFIVTITPFLIWLPCFSIFIYPNLDFFCASETSQLLQTILPENLRILAGLIHYWPLALFFALAELWGTGVLCLLFWTAVNDTNNTETATQNYPLITAIANTASIFSGPLLLYCLSLSNSSNPSGWHNSMIFISWVFFSTGILIIFLHETSYQISHADSARHIKRKIKKTTTNLSLTASARYLIHSPYLGYIALVMLSYCIAINTIEIAWKSQLVKNYTTETEYAIFMGKLTFLNGIGCIICGLIAPRLLKRSWKTAALAPPAIMSLTAIPFFVLVLLSDTPSEHLPTYAINLTALILIAGMICNVLGKSAKYTLFDTTKEMTFVPLNDEQKYKGKAAIELLVSRLGKSGSSFLQQGLILAFGTLTQAMSWLTGTFLIICLIWFFAVKQLNRHYKNQINANKTPTCIKTDL